MEARELLKKIGVIKEIKECTLNYQNKIEESWKIVTELGEIDFTITQLKERKVSKLDYFNNAYKFNRNVNLVADFV